jgi:hypothetical protein
MRFVLRIELTATQKLDSHSTTLKAIFDAVLRRFWSDGFVGKCRHLAQLGCGNLHGLVERVEPESELHTG